MKDAKIDLESVKAALNGPVFVAEDGDYAILVDEDDENGLVNVHRKDGTPIMVMPREVWDQLRDWDGTTGDQK